MTRTENISCQSSDREPWREGHRGWNVFCFVLFFCLLPSERAHAWVHCVPPLLWTRGGLPPLTQTEVANWLGLQASPGPINHACDRHAISAISSGWLTREPTEGLTIEGGLSVPVFSLHRCVHTIDLGATSFEFLLSCSRSGRRSHTWIWALGWVDASLQHWTEFGH